MAGAYFYFASLSRVAEEFPLNEPASRHIVQVLRMQEGEELILTDGLGLQAMATILDANKKHCRVRISERKFQKPDARRVTIALSLLKNTNRFEWFLEKATELGISEIIPLKCSTNGKAAVPQGANAIHCGKRPDAVAAILDARDTGTGEFSGVHGKSRCRSEIYCALRKGEKTAAE